MHIVYSLYFLQHVFEGHLGKNDKPFICRWKDCSTKEKPFKSQEYLILHMHKHISQKSPIHTVSIKI